MVRLVATATDGSGSVLQLQSGVNRIGRDPENTARLDDPSVSSFHCEITVADEQVTVKDLNSTNGTFVNGHRIDQAVLFPGQRLQLGSVEMACELIPESGASERPTTPEPPAAAPPIPRAVTPCRYHPTATAQWICSRCQAILCDACVKLRPASGKTWRLCPVCNGDCSSLAAHRAQREQVRPQTNLGFFRRLPGVFAYPFTKGGVMLLVGGTILFWLLDLAKSVVGFAGLLGLVAAIILFVFSSGYLFAYMQRLLVTSCQGEENLPGWPEFTEWGSDIIRPMFMWGFTLAVCFAPPVIYLILKVRAGEDLNLMILYPLAAFGFLYFPMALLAVALSDNFFALNPFVVLPAIMKVPGQYLVAAVMFFVLVAVRHLSERLLRDVLPVPVVPALLVGFMALYFLAVEMRVLGLLYFTNRDRIAWFRR